MNIPGFSEVALAEVSAMLKFAESPCNKKASPEKPKEPQQTKTQQAQQPRQPQQAKEQAKSPSKPPETKPACPG